MPADDFTSWNAKTYRWTGENAEIAREAWLAAEARLFATAGRPLPEVIAVEELHRVHSPEYLHKLREGSLSDAEQRRIGLPWSPELVERSRRSTGATIEVCRAALVEGVAVSLAGGTHHAFRDAGEGFCVFN